MVPKNNDISIRSTTISDSSSRIYGRLTLLTKSVLGKIVRMKTRAL